MIAQRFIIIGDLHKPMQNSSSSHTVGVDDRTGAPVTPERFQDRFDLLLGNLRKEKEQTGLDFVVCNGDLIHSSAENPLTSLATIKRDIEYTTGVPLYAGYGNHDRVSDAEWMRVFGHGRNHAFSVGDYGHILLQTSDEAGGRQLCIGDNFLKEKLADFENKRGIFVYAHIPRYGGIRPGTRYDSPDCTEIMQLLETAPNLCGVFHSHFHEEDRIFRKQGINILFTGHVAHYGLDYYGYRIVEIQEDGQMVSYQYDVINKENRYRDELWEVFRFVIPFHYRISRGFSLKFFRYVCLCIDTGFR